MVQVRSEWRTIGPNGDSCPWPTRAHAEGFANKRWRHNQEVYTVERRDVSAWASPEEFEEQVKRDDESDWSPEF